MAGHQPVLDRIWNGKITFFKERQEQQKKERQLNLEKKNQQAKEKGKGFKDQRAKLEKAEALKKEEMKRLVFLLVIETFLQAKKRFDKHSKKEVHSML